MMKCLGYYMQFNYKMQVKERSILQMLHLPAPAENTIPYPKSLSALIYFSSSEDDKTANFVDFGLVCGRFVTLTASILTPHIIFPLYLFNMQKRNNKKLANTMGEHCAYFTQPSVS